LLPRFYTFKAKKHSVFYLTPFFPLSFKGEGEEEERGAKPLLNTPLNFGKGIPGIGSPY